MLRCPRLLVSILLLAVVASCQAKPYCTVTADRAVLGNAQIRREWVRQGQAWRTATLARGDGSTSLVVPASEEFSVKLYQGATISGDACQWSAPRSETKQGQTSLTFVAGDAGTGLRVTVRFWLRGDEPFLRKSITITGPADTIIDELEVEGLRCAAPTTRGGFGQPIFLADAWYLGLEYPAGYNDIRKLPEGQALSLHHYPGRALGQGLTSKTAVLGVTPVGLTRELAFSDYLDTVRIQTRNFMQYNSWYDLQGNNLTIPNLLKTFQEYKVNLLDPYGLQMDAFVPDDGWQDRNSIWTPVATRFPAGFRPLSDGLAKAGSHLGIWMPLNGTNLNVDWGRAQGYEAPTGAGYYCIVGPKYNAEIRRVTERLIRDGRLNYYKHDFNTMSCSTAGHGHLPDRLHGHEASMDAEIGLLAWERQVNPGIFLNVTSSVWLSPWWLMYADSIWMCASDNGYEKTYPQLSPREWDMSYRDAHFYQVYRREGNLVPLSSLMTHGIIHGQLCRLGGSEETLREFSDMTVLYYARGVQLKELYITPSLMDKQRWQVLGEATRWAVDNSRDLRHTVLVGGDLRQGEPYGYVHWNGDHGTVVLRNPAPGAASVTVPFNQSVFYRGKPGRSFEARVIYPYYEATPVHWVSGQEHSWQVPGVSVLLVDVRPAIKGRADVPVAAPATLSPIVGQPTVTVPQTPDGGPVSLSFTLPAGETPRSELYLILRGPGQADISRVEINGTPATPRKGNGNGWRLRAYDLRPYQGRPVTVTAQMPSVGDRPFSATHLRLEAWVIADVPVTGDVAQPTRGHTPFPIAQGYRRASIKLADAALERGTTLKPVTDEEVAHLKGAQLRVEVFDANGQPPYGDKWITLNGERIAKVPANQGQISAWQECFITLTPSQVARLQRTNTITLGNAGGDAYKFRGVALSLQKPDGQWVVTAMDEGTYCSAGGGSWPYEEGQPFRGNTSPEIKLVIP